MYLKKLACFKGATHCFATIFGGIKSGNYADLWYYVRGSEWGTERAEVIAEPRMKFGPI